MILKISHNSASTYRGCPKKYYWSYIQGLKPKKKAISLTVGGIVHEGFDKFYHGTSDNDVLLHIQKRFDDDIAKATVDEQEDLRVGKYIAEGMWMYYPWKNVKEWDQHFPEKEFDIPFPGLRGVRLVGRVDGLVKKNGNWWVREFKTTGLTPRQFEGRCKTSAQVTGYVYAMRELGYAVQGVLFDAIKKPLLRKRKTDTVDDYGKRIIEDYKADASLPEKDRKCYSRPTSYRKDSDLRLFHDDMAEMVRDIRRRRRSNVWWRNQDYCWSFNSECPYEKICFMDSPDPLTMQVYFDKKQ